MSMIFTPFYLPIVGLIALFIFSYMSLLPMMYKLVMLAMVDLHGLRVDVWLERVEGVGQRGKCEGHGVISVVCV